MVSKLIIAMLAVVGVAAGFALAGPPRANAPSLSSALEISQLYRREVTMTAQESHLQQLLGFARAELARPAAPAPAAIPAPQAVLIASPASPPPSGPAAPTPSHAPSVPPPAGSAVTTTTEPPPTTTTTTTPPTTTTTTTPPTTTTTRPRDGGDGGGGDD